MAGARRACVRPLLARKMRLRLSTGVNRSRQAIGGLGGPQKQVTARAQGKMEHLHDVALYVAVEVNQQVPADNQVDLRKRRVQQQAVLGEQHFLADFLAHAEVLVVPRLKYWRHVWRRDVG